MMSRVVSVLSLQASRTCRTQPPLMLIRQCGKTCNAPPADRLTRQLRDKARKTSAQETTNRYPICLANPVVHTACSSSGPWRSSSRLNRSLSQLSAFEAVEP